jgi:hypothetical protein
VARRSRLQKCLDALAQHQGVLQGGPPRDPWAAILFHNVVPVAEEARRERAFAALQRATGLDAGQMLAASDAALSAICGAGAPGMAQVQALRRCAEVWTEQGDPSALVQLPEAQAIAALQAFPLVDAAFAAQLLLLLGKRERLALESHGLRTLIRIGYGLDENAGNYGQRLDPWLVHESAVDAAEPELDEGMDVRIDASLRLRALGLSLCTKRPQCARCPIANLCDLSRLIGKNR